MPLCDSTYICRYVSGVMAPGEKDRGTERKALIRRGASRVEGQCSGEIGQLHGKRKPSVTTFFLFHSSAFPFFPRLSTPPVILNMVLLSHAALMAASCACEGESVSLLVFVYE